MFTRHFRLALLAVIALLPLANIARAGGANPPRSFVILVGISQYEDAKIEPRRHAEADAKALYDLLSKREMLGADPRDVKLLLGKEDTTRRSIPATRANILKALGDVAKEARRDDLVFFAFFGRGGGEGKRVGLFGVDANVKKPADAAITGDDLKEIMASLGSQRFCALLDVHLGGFANSDKALAEAEVLDLVRMFLGDDRVWGYLPPVGRVVFLPNMPLKAPLELEKNGAVAATLVEALKGAADSEGYEADGHILIGELDKYLKVAVPDLARKHGKTKEAKDYQLAYFPGRYSHFAVTRNPATADRHEKQQKEFAKAAEAGALPKEVVDEGTRLLERMPRAKSLQELRKSYQKLATGAITAKDLLAERDAIAKKLAMPKAESQVYAKSVMQAVTLIRKEFHEDLPASTLVGWGIRSLYFELDEPLPMAISARLDEGTKLTDADLNGVLADARLHLGKRDDLADRKDLDVTLRHLTQQIRDKYTRYYDAAEAKRLADSSAGRFAGIGVQIRKDTARNGVAILTAFRDGPAYKTGIRGGDLLVSVTKLVDTDGKRLPKPETVSTKELEISDVVKLVVGKPGTPVKLGVLKAGAEQTTEIEVERDWVMVESVVGHHRKADDSWDYWLDPKDKIAYIRLLEFSGTSQQDMKKLIMSLKDDGAKGLVLDLRFNPGGLLRAAIGISDLFVEEGLIVTVKSRSGPDKMSKATGAGRAFKLPMVCLINEHSASGSEILAAALQDHKRARMIGERTFGKGTVAGVFDYSPTKALFTISNATFWRPNGKNLNRFTTKGGDDEDWGVKPDEGFHVKLTNQERLDLFNHLREREYIVRTQMKSETPADFRDRQLDKAIEYLREQVK